MLEEQQGKIVEYQKQIADTLQKIKASVEAVTVGELLEALDKHGIKYEFVTETAQEFVYLRYEQKHDTAYAKKIKQRWAENGFDFSQNCNSIVGIKGIKIIGNSFGEQEMNLVLQHEYQDDNYLPLTLPIREHEGLLNQPNKALDISQSGKITLSRTYESDLGEIHRFSNVYTDKQEHAKAEYARIMTIIGTVVDAKMIEQQKQNKQSGQAKA